MIKLKLATALLAATALSPAIALAQSAPAPTSSPAPTQTNASVSEIIVTAQRRSERLTDVPIAITAITGAEMQAKGVKTAMDLNLVTPGLYIETAGAFAQPTIRGIGTSVAAPGFDANVAIYIDGVYQPSQTANIFDFNGVENVEVLKGPQGTLFGRNATGGAIEVTTLDPSSHPSGDLLLSYGRFNAVKATGYVTGGLTENLAANLSVLYTHDDGYITNVTTGNRIAQDNNTALRGKLLWTPTDQWRIIFSANYSDAFNTSPFSNKPLNGDTSQAAALAAAHLVIPSDPYKVALNGDPDINTVSYGGSANVRYQGDQGTLTSITSYEVVHPFLAVDIDNTPIFASGALIRTPELTFTQEVNFASKPMGPFSWIGGVYFYYDHTAFDLLATSGFVPAPNIAAHITADTKDEAEAAFAEGNYNITDKLQLIVGGRFSTEIKHATNSLVGTPVGLPLTSKRWNSFTPRVALTYKLDPNSNIYFNYSQGFKSGGYNIVAFNQATPVNPENVNAFEIGYKHSDGQIRFNASAFYYDYSNIQVQIQTNAGGVVSTFLQNAAKATIYGADFDLTDRFNEYFRVDLGAAYTHGVYNHYVGAIETFPIFTTIGGVSYSNGNSQIASATPLNDIPMIRTPKIMANITPTFDYPLPLGRLEANATVSYNSGFIWALGTVANESLWKQPDYTILNATITWISPDDKYRLSVWGRNLTSTKYIIYENATGTGTGADIGAPWSVGVSADVKFP